MPDWDDSRFSFGNEDEEGEEWKPNPTREACKVLYRQWLHVVFLLKGLLDHYSGIAENENDIEQLMLNDTARDIVGDAHIVGAKIMSSEAGGIYIIRMEHAAIIRQLAQGVATSLLLFLENDIVDEQHIKIVRAEIDKFRELFIIWVNTFQKDEFSDEWGLFV